MEQQMLVDSRCSALLAEYSALRSEIDLYHAQQKELMNFVLLTSAAMFGTVGAITALEYPREALPLLFLIFPWLYCLLGFLYADRTIRIIRVANYLHNHVRRKLDKLLDMHVMQWEIYKRTTSVFNRRLALVLDRVRWCVFLLPSAFSVILFFIFVPGVLRWYHYLLISGDCVLVILDILVIFVTEETTGISDRPEPDLDRLS